MSIPLRHRRSVVFLFALLAALALPGIARLRLDNSPEVFFVRDARSLGLRRQLAELFPAGRSLRWSAGGPGLWTAAGLRWLGDAEIAAAGLPGVIRVSGLAGHHGWLAGAWPPADPAALRAAAAADPVDGGGGWVSADGSTAGIVLEVARQPRARDRALLAELERLSRTAPAGVKTTVTGLPVIEAAMDASLAAFVGRIVPLLALLAVVLLGLAFRSVADTVVPLAVVAAVLATVMGAMGWAGEVINLVNSVLVGILFVIALATAVHLQSRHRVHRSRGLDAATAAAATLGEKRWAVVWTGLTTGAAFGSLALSRLGPVRSLGVWAGLGIALLAVAELTLHPVLLTRCEGAPGGIGFERLAARVGRRLASLSVRRRRTIVAIAVAVAMVAGLGVTRLAVDTNLLGYYGPGHPVRRDLEELQRAGLGAVAADLVLQIEGAPESASFRDPERLDRLAELAAGLRSRPPVLAALGAGDLLRSATDQMLQEGHATKRLRWLVLGMMQSDPEVAERLDLLVTADGRAARIVLTLPVLGYQALRPALRQAEAAGRSAFPEARVWSSGDYPLILSAQEGLLATLSRSLSLTFLFVALILVGLLRSWARSSAAVAVNLWPVLLVLGWMGWSSLPLDSTTVMVAAVALGLAVDDTFHTLGELRREGDRPDLPAAISRVAPAQLLTTLVLAVGFLACGLSDFRPVSRFGLLTGGAVIAALVADWLLLPALLTPGRRAQPLSSEPKTEP